MKNGQLINIISGKWAGRQAFYSEPRNGRQFLQLVDKMFEKRMVHKTRN